MLSIQNNCGKLCVDASIYQTMKNAGEIEIVFDQSFKDHIKVILAVDNGGWSMEPFVSVVQTIFDYTRAQFKDLKTYFFHNTIYGTIWKDPAIKNIVTGKLCDFERISVISG